jgi:hypothetical protein
VQVSHRLSTRANPDAVWELIGNPREWTGHDLLVEHVECAGGPVREGMHLVVVLRGVPLRVPVDVRRVDPGVHLGITIHVAPGLREERDYLLTRRARGGTEIRYQARLYGFLAMTVIGPSWVSAALSLRALSHQAARLPAVEGTAGSGAA